jgi:prophage antirepressor-like protein
VSDMQLFNFHDHEIRTVMIDGEIRFVGKDICDALEIINVHQALSRLDESDVCGTYIRSGGQVRSMSTVTREGMFDLVFESNKDEAKAFRKWITHEVLPQIDKTGMYVDLSRDKEFLRAQFERHMQSIKYKVVVRDTLKRLDVTDGVKYASTYNHCLKAITGLDAKGILRSGRAIVTFEGKKKPTKRDKDTATNYLSSEERASFDLLTDTVSLELRRRPPVDYSEMIAAVKRAIIYHLQES